MQQLDGLIDVERAIEVDAGEFERHHAFAIVIAGCPAGAKLRGEAGAMRRGAIAPRHGHRSPPFISVEEHHVANFVQRYGALQAAGRWARDRHAFGARKRTDSWLGAKAPSPESQAVGHGLSLSAARPKTGAISAGCAHRQRPAMGRDG
jgi:hypothetical protein